MAGDAGSGERSRVGDGDVSVNAIEKCGVIAADFIEILPRGEHFICPEGVVPVAAGEPVSGGRVLGGRLDFGEHFVERFDAGEVDVELGATSSAEMRMRVVEAGEDVVAGAGGVEIVEDGLRSGETRDLFGFADGEDFAAADGLTRVVLQGSEDPVPRVGRHRTRHLFRLLNSRPFRSAAR